LLVLTQQQNLTSVSLAALAFNMSAISNGLRQQEGVPPLSSSAVLEQEVQLEGCAENMNVHRVHSIP